MVKIVSKIFVVAFVFLCFTQISIAQTIKPIKILLVPGHDDAVWGAQFGNMKEADMTLSVATQIYNILKNDPRFEVHITRDAGGYTKEFADYFANHQADIMSFLQNAKNTMQNKIASGNFIVKKNVPHNTVSEEIALRLYGFNKWANENKIDVMIQVHFNDYSRRNIRTIGKYKGFTIYLPDGQFSNSKESALLAADIYTQLHTKYISSTYKPEAGGLIPDQKLIAIGANNTLDSGVRSVLIEYSYIYEKIFRTKSSREQAFTNMASLTAQGITNHFFGN
jgi:N-acetylmuramoyl-L-alanine amidase